MSWNNKEEIFPCILVNNVFGCSSTWWVYFSEQFLIPCQITY